MTPLDRARQALEYAAVLVQETHNPVPLLEAARAFASAKRDHETANAVTAMVCGGSLPNPNLDPRD